MKIELQEVASLMPDVIHEMIDLVGFADVEKLIHTFGGVSFRFTEGTVYYPRLVELLGNTHAQKLQQYFCAEHVYIPRCEVALRALRNLRFKADYDSLTQDKKMSGRQAMLELCPKYQISDRLGWDIVSKVTKSAVQNGFVFD